ncbi:MAG: hypothetical protein ABI862_15935 [Ilumatobacteraceae bacterium]
MIDPLVAAILTDTPTPDWLQYGTVTQASPLQVRVGAATTGLPCRRLASYTTPVAADFVAVLVVGADRVCLGKVIV